MEGAPHLWRRWVALKEAGHSISLFKMTPKFSAEVLCSVLKSKKIMMYLTEETHVLDKVHSDMSYSTLGHEFNVNESTIYIK